MGLSLEARPAGLQSRDGSCARRSVPAARTAERGRAGCAALEVTAEAAPRGWWNGDLPGLSQGRRWLETVLQSGPAMGMCSLRLGRLGGCLSLGGIMSSECNASAYE